MSGDVIDMEWLVICLMAQLRIGASLCIRDEALDRRVPELLKHSIAYCTLKAIFYKDFKALLQLYQNRVERCEPTVGQSDQCET
jgi:hypothetical protein